jgi:rhodanese-related sulfurtransferase
MSDNSPLLTRERTIFLLIGIIIGIIGGYSATNYFLQPKMAEYEEQIDFLETVIHGINSSIYQLEGQINYLLDVKEAYESQISNLTSKAEVLYGDITDEQAKELIETLDSLVILDVRTPREFTGESLKGAINIPVDELYGKLEDLDVESEILVYCKVGGRSSNARDFLYEKGFTKVYNMLGGIEAWKGSGYKTSGCGCG